MEVTYTAESIEAALRQLYQNTGDGYATANQYLTAMQLSPQAWDIAWQLLDMAKPLEVQYFGATTLHAKLSRHFHQVSGVHYDALRTKLLQAVVQYARGPKLVLTKLLAAMASFVVNTVGSFWPTAIQDLLMSFHPLVFTLLAPDHLLKLLLDLLTFIPEELHSTEQSQRGTNRQPLEASSGKVFGLIGRLGVLTREALNCLGAWSQLGFERDLQAALLPRVVACVREEELCVPAIEVLTIIAGHPGLHKFPNFLSELVAHVVQLEDVLSEKMDAGDMLQDSCNHFCELLIEIVESHAHTLVSTLVFKPEQEPSILKLFELLLRCTGTSRQYPVDETWSRGTLTAWHALQDAASSDRANHETLLLRLQPLWQNLFETLLRKARLPLDDSLWDFEQKDALRCCRMDIGDCIMSLYGLLHESLLAALGAHLQVSMLALERDDRNWPLVEACLLALQAVAENVCPGQEGYLGPQLRAALPRLVAHPQLQPATLACLGSLGAWLQDPEQLGTVLPVLLSGLEAGPKTSLAASLALKDLARDCPEALRPHTQPLLEATQRLLLGRNLGPRERTRLFSLAGQLLASWEPPQCKAWLSVVLPQQLPSLQGEDQPRVVQALQELAALVSGLAAREEPPSLVDPLLAQLLPTFRTVATLHQQDELVVDGLCECAKRAAIAVSPAGGEQLLSLLIELQEACPQATILDACRPLLLMLAPSSEQPSAAAATALRRICNATLQPAMTSIHNFRESTAVLDSFYQLLCNVARKASRLLLVEASNLSRVFQCGIVAIGLPEKATVKAAALFLAEVINQSQQHSGMEGVVNSHRLALWEQCLVVVAGDGGSPRSAVEFMADVILALTKQHMQASSACVSQLLMRPGFPSPRLSEAEKGRYFRLLLRERSNKRCIKETLVEMSLVCRGLVGTEYAAQTTQRID
ncbi:importin-13-like protein cdm isoform X1 [Haemaphysalis longicornis]